MLTAIAALVCCWIVPFKASISFSAPQYDSYIDVSGVEHRTVLTTVSNTGFMPIWYLGNGNGKVLFFSCERVPEQGDYSSHSGNRACSSWDLLSPGGTATVEIATWDDWEFGIVELEFVDWCNRTDKCKSEVIRFNN